MSNQINKKGKRLLKAKFAILVSMLALCVGFLAFIVNINATGTGDSVTVSGYDLNDTIDGSNLTFTYDSTTHEATFTGLEPSNDKFTEYTNTLEIPKTVEYGGEDYTVTKVNTTDSTAKTEHNVSASDYGYDADGYLYTIQAYGSAITAVVVPDTVTEINPGAFYGMSSVVYYQAPFVGYKLNDEVNPLHMAFSKGYYGKDSGSQTGIKDYQSEYYTMTESGAIDTSATSNRSTLIYWYNIAENSRLFFEVPETLKEVKITGASATNIIYGNRTFLSISSLVKVTLPEKLIKMGEYAFGECINLKSVDLPSKMSMSLGMFSYCKSLEEIVIPEEATSIGESTFFDCENLSKVYIPATITEIGALAFSGCVKLKTVVYSGEYKGDDTKIVKDEDEINLPSGLLNIGKGAFTKVETITNITIPNGLQTMGENAFQYCKNIEKITLPFLGYKRGSATVDGVDANAFGWIFGSEFPDQSNYYQASERGVKYAIPVKLGTIEITGETNVESMALGNLCYYKNNIIVAGVQTVVINSDSGIENNAFSGSNRLKYLTVPYIPSLSGSTTFSNLFKTDSTIAQTWKDTPNLTTGVTSYIPDALTDITITKMPTIPSGLFHSCWNIENVKIGNYTTWIESNVFYQTPKLTSLTLPFVGRERGEYYNWWWYWRDYVSVNMFTWVFSYSSSGGTYGDYTIADYESYVRKVPSSLKSVTITDETVIGSYAFRNLTSLTDLTILNENNNLSYIEKYAAYNCCNLVNLRLPWIGYDRNDNGYSGDTHRAGYIFGDKAFTGSYSATGYQVPSTLTTITIDYLGSVGYIPDYAFYNMKTVGTVRFNVDVNQVGNYAFAGCSNLSSFTYTKTTNFTTVGNYGFYGCSKIKNIGTIIPSYYSDGVKLSIGDYSLAGTSIETIDFKKFNKIGNYAFANCLNLTEANVRENSNIESFGIGIFAGCSYLTSATLAPGQATAYLFKDCISLTGVNLNDVITNNILPAGIFQNCTSLVWNGTNGLYLPATIETIGANAFNNCTSLTTLVIPDNTKVIEKGAFLGCDNLSKIVIPRNTETIRENVFTEAIGNGFVIWVYENEDVWPSTWVDNWNCLNPVMVIPGDTSAMYKYIYSKALKGYVIVGMADGYDDQNALTGQISLPSSYNAVPVVGIVHDVFKNLTKVTKIIIPDTYKLIGQGAFNNGERVDIYFEANKAKAPNYVPESIAQNFTEITKNDSTSITDFTDIIGYEASLYSFSSNKIETSETYYKNIINSGYVFYGDVWSYGSGVGGSSTPYVKLSSMESKLDDSFKATYTGNAWTPSMYYIGFDPEYVGAFINSGKSASSSIGLELSKSLFNYSYTDNILAGQAKLNYSLNTTEYAAYLSNARTYGDYTIYLTGSGSTPFTIEKYVIDLFYDANGINYTTYFTAEYNPNAYFTLSSWNSGNNSLYGQDFGSRFTFSGTLRTYDKDAGTYASYGDNCSEAKSDGLVWSMPWKVTLTGSGAVVTKNFDVNVYVTVEIKPMDVVLRYSGRSTVDYMYYKANHYAYSNAFVYYSIAKATAVTEDNYMNYYVESTRGTETVYVLATTYDGATTYYSFSIITGMSVTESNYENFYVEAPQMAKYEYTGYQISPSALAYRKGTSGDYEEVKLSGCYVETITDYTAENIIYPNSDYTSWAYAGITGDGAKNYKIVNVDTRDRYTSSTTYYNITNMAITEYKVVKANVIIEIRNNKYLIGIDDDYYYNRTWADNYVSDSEYIKITGLSDLSTIYGEIRSKSNERGLYSSFAQEPSLSWSKVGLSSIITDSDQINFLSSNSVSLNDLNFVIVQKETTEGTTTFKIYENDYYNVTLNAEIQIIYNEFKLGYYIVNDPKVDNPIDWSTVVEELSYTPSVSLSYENDSKYKYTTNHNGEMTYGFDGDGSRYFKMEALNDNIYDNKNHKPEITYTITDKDGKGVLANQLLHFDNSLEYEPNLYYYLHVQIKRYNFVTVEETLVIKIVKRDVKYNLASITKVYDGTPISLYGFMPERVYYTYNSSAYILYGKFSTEEEYLRYRDETVLYYLDGSDYQTSSAWDSDKEYYVYKNSDYIKLGELTEKEYKGIREANDLYYYSGGSYVKATNFIVESGLKSTIYYTSSSSYYEHKLKPEVQSVTTTFFTKTHNSEGAEVWHEWTESTNPTYPGTYYVLIEASKHDFYNSKSEYVEFTISKRPIDLYVDRTDPFWKDTTLKDGTDNVDAYKIYDGIAKSIVINSVTAPSLIEKVEDGVDIHAEFRKSLFVGTDNVYGTLSTTNSIPYEYTTTGTSTLSSDWQWGPQWMVLDENGIDHTEYYEIILHDSFEIKNRTFVYSITPYDGTYDGAYHSISVNVSYPESSSDYNIKYYTDKLDEDSIHWRSANYYYASSNNSASGYEYPVWVKISGQYFDTVIVRSYVKIKNADMSWDVPTSFKRDADNNLVKVDKYGNKDASGDYYFIDYTWDTYSVGLSNVDPVDATRYYKLEKLDANNSYVLIYRGYSVPQVSSIGVYQLHYKLTASDYNEIDSESHCYYFVVNEAQLDPFTSFTITGYTGDYDGDEHTISVTFDTTNTNYQSEYNNAKFYYAVITSSTDEPNYSMTSPNFINAGTYTVRVKVTGNGIYKTVINDYIVQINKITFASLTDKTQPSVSSYTGFYDGYYHGVVIDLGDFTHDPLDKGRGTTEITYNTPVIYYTTYIYQISDYIDNYWTTTAVTRKDVSTTQLMVRITLENYETLSFDNLSIVITQNPDPSTTYTDNYQIQYKKDAISYSDLGIKTIHDATPKVFYYLGVKNGTDIEKDSYSQKISAPSELGTYYVEVEYYETKNCAYKKIGFGFEIIPRRVVATYDAVLEYSGYEQQPNPTVNSGTSDLLYLKFTKEGSDDAPLELGTYNYLFEFTEPQTNYVLVIPGSADDIKFFDGKAYVDEAKSGNADYPFAFTISKIELKIIVDAEMECDYENNTYWHVTTDYDWINDRESTTNPKIENILAKPIRYTLLNDEVYKHVFSVDMITSSYARSTYYYNSTDIAQPSNTVYVTEQSILDYGVYEKYTDSTFDSSLTYYERVTTIDGSNSYIVYEELPSKSASAKFSNKEDIYINTPQDVSQYYNVTYDVKVFIHLPYLNPESSDITIDYDGLPHTISVILGSGIRGAVIKYMSEEDYNNNVSWDNAPSNPISYTNAGTYVIYYKIISAAYEDYIGHTKLVIRKTNLNITVDSFDATYDATEHYITHDITNVSNISSLDYIIKYYSVDNYSADELSSFYAKFNSSNSIYTSGLDGITDAGTYYAVIYYPNCDNWYQLVKVVEVTINQRKLYVSFANDLYFEKDYDKEKYQVVIGNSTTGATINTDIGYNSGLISGHMLSRSKSSKIQTISADAGYYYGSTGFEFVSGSIYIRTSTGDDVTMNYKPILEDSNLIVKINKIALPTPTVTDLTKQFDGKSAALNVEREGDGLITYTYCEELSDGSQNEITQLYSANVGYYYLTVDIAEGKNYYAWNGGTLSGHCTIIQRETDIIWSNLEVDFNAEYQIAKASYVDAFGETKDLYVTVRYNGDIYNSVINAGVYEVFANTSRTTNGTTDNCKDSNGYSTELNYSFNNTIDIFTINKITYKFVITETTDNTEKVWSRQFDNSNVGTTITDDVFIQGTKFDNVTIENTAHNGKAVIKTANNTVGTYYQKKDFDFSDVYIKTADGLDVTSSINFEFSGVITIIANKIITVEHTDDIVFDNTNHSLIGDIIKIINPISYSKATWTFKINGGDEITDAQSPYVKDYGTYEIYYSITIEPYEIYESTFTINVVKKTSFINFYKTLDKSYDGTEIDANVVKASILNAEYNGYNSDNSNLVFTFYSASTNEKLTSNPVTAGDYKVVITSSVDDVDSETKNYTTLNVERYFSITSKAVDLTVNLDVQIDNDTVTTYSSTPEKKENLAGLAAYTTLYYQITASDFLTNKYVYSGVVGYDTNNTTQHIMATAGDGDQTEIGFTWYVYVSDEDKAKTLLSSKNQPVVEIEGTNYPNVSGNYSINLKLSIDIHYRRLTVDMRDVTFSYDGYEHWGQDEYNYISAVDWVTGVKYYTFDAENNKYEATDVSSSDFESLKSSLYVIDSSTILEGHVVGLKNDNSNTYTYPTSNTLTKVYGTNKDYGHSSIKDICFSKPGTYEIYYKYTLASSNSNSIMYEPYEGIYKLVIEKMERTLEININTTTTYNGSEGIANESYKGYNVDYTGSAIYYKLLNGKYLPDYTLTYPALASTISEDSSSDISVSYVKEYSQDKLDYPVDAGKYRVILEFSETYYYKAAKAEAEFEIKKKDIYVLGTYETEYTGQVVTYGGSHADFTDSSSIKFYVFDSVNKKLIELESESSGFSYIFIDGLTLRTTNKDVDTYYASNGNSSTSKGVYFSGIPQILKTDASSVSHDITSNFKLNTSLTYTDSEGTTKKEEACILIVNGKIEYEVLNPTEFKYKVDTNNIALSQVVSVTKPESGATVLYSTDKKNWSTTKPSFKDINFKDGEIVPWKYYAKATATNYSETGVIELECKIVKGDTTFAVTELSKRYDGNPVYYPKTLTLNHDEVTLDKLIIEYYYYDSYNNKISMARDGNGKPEEYPVNAGKYMISITAPETTHFNTATVEYDFEITGIPVSLNWSAKSFVYDGTSQAPVASFDALKDDNNINIIYDYKPDSGNVYSDSDHKSVGTYTVTAKLQDISGKTITNYIFDTKSTTTTFVIVKRPITITFRGSASYNSSIDYYAIYDSNPSIDLSNVKEYVGSFTTSNLVASHSVSDSSWLKTASNIPGNYTKLSNTEFTWGGLGKLAILDTSGNDLAFNYSVTYDLFLNINYKNLKVSAIPYTGDYDGEYHSIELKCYNVFQDNDDKPKYYYAWDEYNTGVATGLTYSSDKPTFKESGVYKVYYRVGCTGYLSINGESNPDNNAYALVTINKVDAGLKLVNSSQVFDKYYDGKAVAVPLMEFNSGVNIDTKEIKYEWYWLKHDSSLYIKSSDSSYVKINGYDANATYYTYNSTESVYENANISSETGYIAQILGSLYVKDYNNNYITAGIYDENATYYTYDTSTNGVASYDKVTIAGQTDFSATKDEYDPIQSAVNAGKYKFIASVGTQDNYKDAVYERTFIIKKRTLNVTTTDASVTKTFDGLTWSALITNDKITYDLINISGSIINYYSSYKDGTTLTNPSTDSGKGLINGEVIKTDAELNTKSSKVGVYSSTNDFYWTSNVVIYKASGSSEEVQRNYDINVLIYATITEADIEYEASSFIGSVDGKEHSISVKVTTPEYATIKYSTVNDESSFTTTPITRSDVGIVTVFFKIEAENYRTVTGNRVINITGKVNTGELNYQEEIIYGDPYTKPIYANTPSTGTQTVKYYTSSDFTTGETTDKPTNAGTYYFILHLDTDGFYSEEDFTGTFKILPREVTVVWGNYDANNNKWTTTTDFAYTNAEIKPFAYVTDTMIINDYPSDIKTVSNDLGNNIQILFLDVNDQYKKVNVGTYHVEATLNDNNYKLINSSVDWNITKQEVEIPNIDTTSVYEYYFEKTRVDASGNTIYLDDADEYYVSSSYDSNAKYYEKVDKKEEATSSNYRSYYYFNNTLNAYIKAENEMYDINETYYSFVEVTGNIMDSNVHQYFIQNGNTFEIPAVYDSTGATTYYTRELLTSKPSVGPMYTLINGVYMEVALEAWGGTEVYYKFNPVTTDINDTNYSSYYRYTESGTEDTRTFGDEVIVRDIYGNKYYTDDSGEIKKIEYYNGATNENPKLLYVFILDSDTDSDEYDGNKYLSNHALTISLKDKDNYCWKGVSDPDADRYVDYIISPYTLPSSTENTLARATISASIIEYTGSAIEPEPIVRFYQGNDLIFTMTKAEEVNGELVGDYTVTYENNIKISNDDTKVYKKATSYDSSVQYYQLNQTTGVTSDTFSSSTYFILDETGDYIEATSFDASVTYYKVAQVASSSVNSSNVALYYEYGDKNPNVAKIYIKGVNNFDFSITLTFEIAKKAPDQFILIEGAKPAFIYVEEQNGYITFKNLLTNSDIERDEINKPNIYLSNIYNKTTINKLLTQFSNDTSLISVYSVGVDYTKPELAIDVNDYDSSSYYVSTGMHLVLRDDKGNIVDTIECIVAGDIDGNGCIQVIDVSMYHLINKNVVNYDGLKDADTLATATYTDNQFYTVTQYYAAIIDNDNYNKPNVIQVSMMQDVLNRVSDINAEYKID